MTNAEIARRCGVTRHYIRHMKENHPGAFEAIERGLSVRPFALWITLPAGVEITLPKGRVLDRMHVLRIERDAEFKARTVMQRLLGIEARVASVVWSDAFCTERFEGVIDV